MALDTNALARIYGSADPQALAAQERRYARALEAFARRYGPGEVRAYHAPGRVNLIGEHTDYNHGYVMPVALDKDVLLLARPRRDGVVRMDNLEGGFPQRTFSVAAEISPQPVGDWANYAQGPAEILEREHGPGLHGLDALVDGGAPYGVPRGAGLSSSSALTVAFAVALAEVNDLGLAGPALADACSRAEWYVGTRGGIMDQFISVLARQEHALFLDCRPAADGSGYAYRHVPLPAEYAIVVADSGLRHTNTGPHYNRRVAECRIGVRLLAARYPGITHLRDVEDHPWPEIEPLLPEAIDREELLAMGIDPARILDSGVDPQTDTFSVRRRCRHVVTENRRVLDACEALEAGDVARLGTLMNAAHESARDDYEISTPEIEALVRLALGLPGAVAARLTGAGWGGCIVALVAQEAAGDFAARLVAGYRAETNRQAQVFVCHSAAGAGLVLQTRV
ncbi:MAG: galactokinase [Chloroflexi bacterium]|nr:galactokinase [Chloroflexota bacterium]